MIHEHKGHRERMKARFEHGGAELMDTYELLEMLLFRCKTVATLHFTAETVV